MRVNSDMVLTAMYGMIELAVVYPTDPGIIFERGDRVSIEWDPVNVPKGTRFTVSLVKGETEVWTLSDRASKSPLRWTVGASIRNQDPYPNGDDYTIVVSALDGTVLAESENPFTIDSAESLDIVGPTSVQGGTDSAQYTCIAHYTFGGDMDVTPLVKWRCIPSNTPRSTRRAFWPRSRCPRRCRARSRPPTGRGTWPSPAGWTSA